MADPCWGALEKQLHGSSGKCIAHIRPFEARADSSRLRQPALTALRDKRDVQRQGNHPPASIQRVGDRGAVIQHRPHMPVRDIVRKSLISQPSRVAVTVIRQRRTRTGRGQVPTRHRRRPRWCIRHRRLGEAVSVVIAVRTDVVVPSKFSLKLVRLPFLAAR